eukprot:CAMPEP_0177510680 /NCGR_PEP_ID=MMETSP0369-20130122/42252_1 /TAXON_ID=447022 ORGANISM="Scrippsiella hangoei-like, Strain SHHI-4" /NCGR_SAMPLE_ID=MMETSP0369 /ASSEMBLY_ACC=CAM_ASM_000364 /LENGTH=57 /DNA_ID=CAMNT_0018988999 /DNA_START=76 /DNA_END=246 /DNA_ORIENTATION=-
MRHSRNTKANAPPAANCATNGLESMSRPVAQKCGTWVDLLAHATHHGGQVHAAHATT